MKGAKFKKQLKQLSYDCANEISALPLWELHKSFDINLKYDEKIIDLIIQFEKEIKLQTLKDTQMLFKIQSDLSTKTRGYKGLCEQIIKLTK